MSTHRLQVAANRCGPTKVSMHTNAQLRESTQLCACPCKPQVSGWCLCDLPAPGHEIAKNALRKFRIKVLPAPCSLCSRALSCWRASASKFLQAPRKCWRACKKLCGRRGARAGSPPADPPERRVATRLRAEGCFLKLMPVPWPARRPKQCCRAEKHGRDSSVGRASD